MASRSIVIDTKDIPSLLAAISGNEDLAHIAKRLTSASKKIKVSSAKAKGRRLQQDVCAMISEAIGIGYAPGDDGLIESRGMGQAGTDVALRGEAREKFPFAVECKCTEQLDLAGAISQAKANTPDGMQWMLIHRRKRLKRDVAVVDAQLIMDMVKLILEYTEGKAWLRTRGRQ